MVSLGSRLPCQSCVEHDTASQGGADVAHRHSLSRVDGHWRGRHSRAGHPVFPRARIVPPVVFHHYADSLDCGFESRVILKGDDIAPNGLCNRHKGRI